MSCEHWQEQISAYIDAELPAAEMESFRTHVQTCASCATAALGASQMKRGVASAGRRYIAPAELRARVAELSRGESLPRRPALVSQKRGETLWPRPWQWAIAAAAVVVVTIGLFGLMNRRQESQSLREFADLHVANLASANPVEVVSTDRHTVKPWFQGRIPFTFNLPDLQGTPFMLVGGRVAYFHQEPAAHLLCAYQRHRISVFILRDTPQLALPAESADGNGSSFSMRTWTQNGLRYVLISDANPDIVRQLSVLLQHAS